MLEQYYIQCKHLRTWHALPRCLTRKHPSGLAEAAARPKCLSSLTADGLRFVADDLNGCCLMAPWIMEKDDFKYTMSFGDDLFGGPPWGDYTDDATTARIAAEGAGTTIPLALDNDGNPLCAASAPPVQQGLS
eukprot:COSAG04_NODE_3279_length_2980_cov_1.509198_3_plen_133_part_00